MPQRTSPSLRPALISLRSQMESLRSQMESNASPTPNSAQLCKRQRARLPRQLRARMHISATNSVGGLWPISLRSPSITSWLQVHDTFNRFAPELPESGMVARYAWMSCTYCKLALVFPAVVVHWDKPIRPHPSNSWHWLFGRNACATEATRRS